MVIQTSLAITYSEMARWSDWICNFTLDGDQGLIGRGRKKPDEHALSVVVVERGDAAEQLHQGARNETVSFRVREPDRVANRFAGQNTPGDLGEGNVEEPIPAVVRSGRGR